MSTHQGDTCESQPGAELEPDSRGSSTTARRIRFLYFTGLIMLAAWVASSFWKSPQSRSTILLQALLFLLIVIRSRVSRKRKESLDAIFSRPGPRRTIAAILPLLVLALFGLSQFLEGRQREAEKQASLRKDAWKQTVERQREKVKLAEKRSSDSLERYTDAFKSLGKTWENVTTPDGQTVARPHRDAMKKLSEAKDEVTRAMEFRRVESERLFQLQRERPNR
jgi:hypothetical protein